MTQDDVYMYAIIKVDIAISKDNFRQMTIDDAEIKDLDGLKDGRDCPDGLIDFLCARCGDTLIKYLKSIKI